jgi:hemolysin activation/secretion protein
MRGYPRATVYGDNGVSFSSGFAFAPYFLPKDLKVPGSKATFYQSTQFFTLVDWATCEKLRPPLGNPKTATLYSYVAGIQMMLPEAFLFRIEAGWPLSDMDTPDGRNHELWLRVSKTF